MFQTCQYSCIGTYYRTSFLGMEITDVQAMVENHLKDMILKSFDPKKADTIFTEEGKVGYNRSSIY